MEVVYVATISGQELSFAINIRYKNEKLKMKTPAPICVL
jgi:hypothetical protein